jgi:4-hydroxy-2-oxoheptanedioate aldolase
MRPNLAKERLKARKPILGLHIPLPSPALVEMAGYIGFHWLYIDMEHGPMAWETIEHMMRAAELANISTMVRPPSGSPEDILHALEAGADGVVIPHIETREEAQEVVKAAKFYPMGERGLGAARWARYGINVSMPEMVKQANERTLVCALIESVKGAENAAAIASVDGIDLVRIGASDLSQSMGLPGQAGHPEVQATMDRIIAAVNGQGKAVATACTDIASAKQWLARGILCTNLAVRDVMLAGGRAFLQEVGVE